jgi:hypothetical protein
MHRSLLVFGYKLVVNAFRLFQKGAHDVSARHAPAQAARSGIACIGPASELRVPRAAQ